MKRANALTVNLPPINFLFDTGRKGRIVEDEEVRRVVCPHCGGNFEIDAENKALPNIVEVPYS